MEKLNKELNKELSDLQIAILSSFPDEGDITEQEICDKVKGNKTSKEIEIAKIKKVLNYLFQHNYITEFLNTSIKDHYKIYEITSHGEEYKKKHTKSNNNQDELKNEQ